LAFSDSWLAAAAHHSELLFAAPLEAEAGKVSSISAGAAAVITACCLQLSVAITLRYSGDESTYMPHKETVFIKIKTMFLLI
jgi:hypothetical protein